MKLVDLLPNNTGKTGIKFQNPGLTKSAAMPKP